MSRSTQRLGAGSAGPAAAIASLLPTRTETGVPAGRSAPIIPPGVRAHEAAAMAAEIVATARTSPNAGRSGYTDGRCATSPQ